MIKIQVEPNPIELNRPTKVQFTFFNASEQNLSSINISFDISPQLIHQSGKASIQFPRLHKNEKVTHSLTLVGIEVGNFPLGFRSFYFRDSSGSIRYPNILPISLEVRQSDIVENQTTPSTRHRITEDYPQTISIVELKNFMITHFNMSELKELCFELKISYEEINEGKPSQTIMCLIEYCNRRNQFLDLLTIVKEKRPFFGNQI